MIICSNIRLSQHVAYVAIFDSSIETFIAYVATYNISKSTLPCNHYLKVYLATDDHMHQHLSQMLLQLMRISQHSSVTIFESYVATDDYM